MRELGTLLTRYHNNKELDNVYQLLKIICNFAIDFNTLKNANIGKTIKHLSKDKDNTQINKIAIKLYNYYDSIVLGTIKKEEGAEEKKEESTESKTEEITITEVPKENAEEKEDKMVTDTPAEISV